MNVAYKRSISLLITDGKLKSQDERDCVENLRNSLYLIAQAELVWSASVKIVYIIM